MDKLQLQIATSNTVKDSCILLTTETWLHPFILASAIELTGYREDRELR